MSNDLNSKLESLLFISNKPLTYQKLADLASVKPDEAKDAVDSLKEKYNVVGLGVKLVIQGQKVQLVTAPESAEVVQAFLKQELTGEMTKPQLETLTIIAYRGPIIKSELEQIRGVNCSLILRNLMMRGLIDRQEDEQTKLPTYSVTHDFLNFLGLTSVEELPDYDKLSRHQNIETLLEQNTDESASAGASADAKANADKSADKQDANDSEHMTDEVKSEENDGARASDGAGKEYI